MDAKKAIAASRNRFYHHVFPLNLHPEAMPYQLSFISNSSSGKAC
jgi:hypothetical protein